jgi:hypothetical protein
LVHDQLPQYNPIFQGGGIGFMRAGDGANTLLPKYLPLFPGKYVCLCYGTNDANMGRPLDQSEITGFYNNYKSMVDQIFALNKIPVIGTIIWSPQDATIDANIQALNTQLAQLKQAYPQILNGPDLYNRFKDHNELFGDGLHPSSTGGTDTLMATWVTWAKNTVYSGDVGLQVNAPSRGPELSLRNSPNPFTEITHITYTLDKTVSVRLAIYDFTGKRIKNLEHAIQPAGAYSTSCASKNMPKGVYLLRLKAGNRTVTNRIMVL